VPTSSRLRRRELLGSAAAAALLSTPLARSQDFKASRPVTLIVPYTAGGSFDTLARAIGRQLSPVLGVATIVDNRPGANGVIAASVAARAPADGHTLLLATDGMVSIAPLLHSKLAYEPDRDFKPVTLMCQTQECIVANVDLPANSLPELIALARRAPGKLAFGSYGIGSNAHLSTELLKMTYGIDMTHVPYKGQAELFQALLKNDIQFVSGTPGLGLEHIRAKKLKVLAVMDDVRTPLFPDVKTGFEQGVPLKGGGWFGIFAPARSPQAVLDRYGKELDAIVNAPAFREEHFTQKGLVPLPAGPQAMQERLQADKVRYQALVSKLGLKLD
jgi:tripartite-type tricarboxylate transporter receptor subunit TctC